MANVTNKIFVDKMGGRSSTQFIGQPGDIFYDPTVGDLRLSDGSTVGGKSLLTEQNAGVYRGFQAGVNFFRNTNDQDIAQVIIHNAGGKVDYINYTSDTNNDDFYVTNLLQQDTSNDTSANKVVMLNIYGATTSDRTPILSISDVRTFVRKFIDTVLFDEEDNERDNLDDVKTAFYANITPLSQSLPDGTLFEQFAFDDWKRVHWPEYSTPAGVTQYADVKFHINNLDDTSSTLYTDTTNVIMITGGSGFEIGDTIIMTGGQMGGVDEVNDLTLTVTSLKNGGVIQLNMTSGGTGFHPDTYPNDNNSLSGGTAGASGCSIHITNCTDLGAIASFELRNGGGSGYQIGDTLTLNVGGEDATFEVVTVGANGIDNFNISGTIYRASPGRVPNNNGYWPKMHIGDGRDDQYDNGNYIGTNLGTVIVDAIIDGRKMIIDNVVKSGIELTAGMICTYNTSDYNSNTFTLVAQATDNSNVWYIDNSVSFNGRVRIDGLSYGNGYVTGSNAWGGESAHVTLYDNSIFALVAFGINVNSVYYNGEMGADGNGYKEVSTLLGAHTIDYTVKSIPQSLIQNSEYTIQASDAGKHIYYNDGGNNDLFLTSEVSEQMPIGTAITIVSGGDGSTYITGGDDVSIWGAGFDQTTQWWYIPSNSIGTLLKVAKDKWILSGAGLGID